MCECKKEIEAKLKERVLDKVPDAIDLELNIDGYMFLLGASIDIKPSMKVIGQYKQKTKSGELRAKKIKESLIASFCPFCGERLKKTTTELYL